MLPAATPLTDANLAAFQRHWENGDPEVTLKPPKCSKPSVERTKEKDLADLIALDERIAQAEEAPEELRMLKTERNLLVPFGCLPNEVLVIIFEHCASFRQRGTRRHARWLFYSHVCQRWRNVSLGASHLWSLIDFSHVCLANAMIERSGSAPLDILLEGPLHESPERAVAVECLSSQISRIRSIVIHRDDPEFFVFMRQPAPILETLEVNTTSIASLPIDFFNGGHTPQLRTLNFVAGRLSYCSFYKLMSRNITTLILVNLSSPHRRSGTSDTHRLEFPSSDELVKVLKRMTQLKVLELYGSLPSSNQAPPGSPIIHLPHLERLALDGFMIDCAGLLQYISFHESASIEIRTKDRGTAEDRSRNTAIVLQHLSRIFSESGTDLFKALIISLGARSVLLKAWDFRESIEYDDGGSIDSGATVVNFDHRKYPQTHDDDDKPPPSLLLDFHWSRNPGLDPTPDCDLLEVATKFIPLLQGVETLHLDAGGMVNESLIDFLALFTSVRTLCVKNHPKICSVLNMLSQTIVTTTQHSRLPLPYLETFQLYNINLKRSERSSGVTTEQSLLRFLSFRTKHVTAIKKLVIKKCAFFPSRCDELAAAVPVLEWDEYRAAHLRSHTNSELLQWISTGSWHGYTGDREESAEDTVSIEEISSDSSVAG